MINTEPASDQMYDGIIITESHSYWYVRSKKDVCFRSACATCTFLGTTVHSPLGVIEYITRVYQQCETCRGE